MEKKEVKVLKKILSSNETFAEEIREDLRKRGILYLNLMSSPGSGKTTIMERTAEALSGKISVIVGDVQTTLDAERIAKKGIVTYQINTEPFGGSCHLEAAWVRTAISEMDMTGVEILFVENIGNLICPAFFDLGAHINVVMISVTEGEDKPLKYPLAFKNSQVCVVSKIDLVEPLGFPLEVLRENIRQVNPKMEIIELSARTGEGMDKWLSLLQDKRR